MSQVAMLAMAKTFETVFGLVMKLFGPALVLVANGTPSTFFGAFGD